MASPQAFARRTVKRCAATLDRVRRPAPGVVILIYHRVGRRSQTETDLPTPLFEEQMAFLAASGRVITLDAGLRMMDVGPPGGPDPVVITFDDGTADFADCAMPILQRFGLPATLYLATDFVERNVSFEGDGRPLSWHAVRDVISTGAVTLGSHTHTHPRMDRLDREAAARELDESIALIEDRLGFHPEHFAYPYSVPMAGDADAVVRDRCTSAAVAGSRPNPYGRSDPYRLQRAPVQLSDGMTFFRRKADGGMRLEDTVREVLNAVR